MNDQNLGWFTWLEVKINHIAMAIKSYIIILTIAFAAQLSFVVVLFQIGYMHFRNQDLNFFILKTVFSDLTNVVWVSSPRNDYLKSLAGRAITSMSDDLFTMFIYTSPVLLIVVFLAQKIVSSKTKSFGKSEFIRGARLVTVEAMQKQVKKGDFNFKFGEVPIPKNAETSHMMVIGSAGSGKTQLLKPNIKFAVENLNFKNIIHDIKGDWTSELYRETRGDLIFNPMDTRSLKWTIFNDIKDIMDLKNVCLWLIPDQAGKDPFWQNSARMILESILLYMYQNELYKNEDLKSLLSMPAEKLSETLKDYGKGAEFAEKKDSFLTLQSQMAFIDFLEDGEFSIKKWINQSGGGNVFLLNSEKTDAIMRPVLSLFVNFIGSEILTLQDDLTRRVYFWLDEFTSLQKLPKIMDLLRLGRSKGAVVCLAYQDFQQLEKIYSKEDMRTVINNTASIAVLQLKEPAAAKFFADRFGKQEYKIKSATTSMGVSNNRDGISLSEQIRDDYIVKDSEILNLPSLTAFVMVKDIEGVAKTTISITKLQSPNATFMPRAMTKAQEINLLKRQQFASMVEQKNSGEEMTVEDTEENRDASILQHEEKADYENNEF